MSITREQVADLQPGDVVEYSGHRALKGARVVGPLFEFLGDLLVGGYVVRYGPDKPPGEAWDDLTLTVVSRAPRPLYVNHPRTEPVPGDVVGAPDDDDYGAVPGWRPTWARSVEGNWVDTHTGRPIAGEMLDRLRLLVDGETGQVVQ